MERSYWSGLVPLEPALNSTLMVMKRKAIAGSLIGGMRETQGTLDFCGAHGIVSDIEMIDIGCINDAYERMCEADVKYRPVIDLTSLKQEVAE